MKEGEVFLIYSQDVTGLFIFEGEATLIEPMSEIDPKEGGQEYWQVQFHEEPSAYARWVDPKNRKAL